MLFNIFCVKRKKKKAALPCRSLSPAKECDSQGAVSLQGVKSIFPSVLCCKQPGCFLMPVTRPDAPASHDRHGCCSTTHPGARLCSAEGKCICMSLCTGYAFICLHVLISVFMRWIYKIYCVSSKSDESFFLSKHTANTAEWRFVCNGELMNKSWSH